MLFNSLEYLFLFLPVALIVFLMLARSQAMEPQIRWLVLASMVFYASWKPVYLLLILASLAVNYLLGRILARASPGRVRLWLILGIAFNLGLLGYFKYAGFFVDSLNAFGLWLIPVPEITLPLAISFYSFQQVAYLVDVARRECEEYQFSHYALFVLFFPQLIAGPIVHHREMMPQFRAPRPRAQIPEDFSVGLTFIAIGLFKKVILADSLAQIADPLFAHAANGGELSSLDALLATFSFSFQIYFDFSGYSDIAIGSARLFGIRLPENFNSPYKSGNMIEMWRRWHMTLSRFLRDYLYFSLGGNRHGTVRRYGNLMITMLLGGLWHGAGWTFVVWGGLHGCYLWINHGWRALLKRLGLRGISDVRLLQPVYIALTFTAWSVALVVFRSRDLSTAWHIVANAFTPAGRAIPSAIPDAFADDLVYLIPAQLGFHPGPYFGITLIMAAAAAVSWLLPNTQEFLAHHAPVAAVEGSAPVARRFAWRPGTGFAVLTAFMLCLSVFHLSSISRFIYFQF